MKSIQTVIDFVTAPCPLLSRKRTFDFMDFGASERPLSVKAVIQNLAPETRLANDR